MSDLERWRENLRLHTGGVFDDSVTLAFGAWCVEQNDLGVYPTAEQTKAWLRSHLQLDGGEGAVDFVEFPITDLVSDEATLARMRRRDEFEAACKAYGEASTAVARSTYLDWGDDAAHTAAVGARHRAWARITAAWRAMAEHGDPGTK